MTDDNKQLDEARAWFTGILKQRKPLRAFELIAEPGLWAVLLEDFHPGANGTTGAQWFLAALSHRMGGGRSISSRGSPRKSARP
jgi:hypothetical protein